MAIEVAVVWGSKQGSSRDPGYLSGVITTSLAFCCPHWFFHQVICQSPPFISWAEIPRSAGNPFTLLQKSCCIDSCIWFWSQIETRLLPLLAWVMIALSSWRKFIYCAVCFLKSLVICFCPLVKESRWSPGQDPEVMRCWWGKHHPEKWILLDPSRDDGGSMAVLEVMGLYFLMAWLGLADSLLGTSPSQKVGCVCVWQPTFTWWNNTSEVCLQPLRKLS